MRPYRVETPFESSSFTPDQPANLAGTAQTQRNVLLTWDSQADAQQFDVQYSDDSGETWTQFRRVGSVAQCTVTGLVADTEYDFRIRGVFEGFVGEWSASATVTTLEPCHVEITGDPFAMNEDDTLDITGVSVVEHEDNGPFTFTLNWQNGTVTYVPDTGVMLDSSTSSSFAIVGELSEIQAAIATLHYVPTLNTTGTKSFTATLADFTTNNDSQGFSVVISAVNDAPTVTGTGAALAYTEGDGQVVVDGGLTFADVDSANLSECEFQLTTNYQSAEDVLVPPSDGDGVTWSAFNTGTGKLVATGSVTKAVMQAAARLVKYENTSGDPNTATRTVSVKIKDSAALQSAAFTRQITVAAAP